MMRLACKSATPMMQALSAASKQLSIAEDDEEDEGGSAEAMHHVSRVLLAKKLVSLFDSASSWKNSCISSRSPLWCVISHRVTACAPLTD
jgi:hypothetical protein